jgi:hypothetical protein
MKPLDAHIFSGYVWYGYPTDDTDEFNVALFEYPGEEAKFRFRIKDFVGANSYSNYREEGIILITDTAEKPYAPKGWTVIPLSVADGFGGRVNENTVIRHIYTVSETPEAVFSFFVGLDVPPKI